MLRITVEEFEYAAENKGSYRQETGKRQLFELVFETKASALESLKALLGAKDANRDESVE